MIQFPAWSVHDDIERSVLADDAGLIDCDYGRSCASGQEISPAQDRTGHEKQDQESTYKESHAPILARPDSRAGLERKQPDRRATRPSLGLQILAFIYWFRSALRGAPMATARRLSAAPPDLDRVPPTLPGVPLIQIRMRPDRRAVGARDSLVRRILREFEQRPALSVTPVQAAHLFQMPVPRCARVLTELVAEGKLSLAGDGRYGSRVDIVA
jgi:hypothetical protein